MASFHTSNVKSMGTEEEDGSRVEVTDYDGNGTVVETTPALASDMATPMAVEIPRILASFVAVTS
jgi:hypothetical protein